jgi:hypothetical protein
VEKRSAAPFDRAARVTPATVSDRFSASEMYARFGQKKSEAYLHRNDVMLDCCDNVRNE